jgi:hypothetical protein
MIVAKKAVFEQFSVYVAIVRHKEYYLNRNEKKAGV